LTPAARQKGIERPHPKIERRADPAARMGGRRDIEALFPRALIETGTH
jgi:hypothetical protein